MNLVPIAKSVRIRVECGGEEHTTIDSLLEYFSRDDIEKLYLNGSLNKFLKQSGKDYLPKDCTNVFQIADVLYESNGEIKDEETLLLWWLQDKKYSRNIKMFLEDRLYDKDNNKDYIKRLTSFSNVSLREFLGAYCFDKAFSVSNLATRKKYLQIASEFGNTNANVRLREIEETLKYEEEEKKRYDEDKDIIIPIMQEIDTRWLRRYSYSENYQFESTLNVALYYFPKVQSSPYCREILFYLVSVIALCYYRNDSMENVLTTFQVDIPQKATKTDLVFLLQNEIENAKYIQEPLKKDFRRLASKGGRTSQVKMSLRSLYYQFGLWK